MKTIIKNKSNPNLKNNNNNLKEQMREEQFFFFFFGEKFGALSLFCFTNERRTNFKKKGHVLTVLLEHS
jgi:hypothetical protein